MRRAPPGSCACFEELARRRRPCHGAAVRHTVVFLNGTFVSPEARVVVALSEPGYLLGDGVFATLRGQAGRCFRKREHLDVLERGAALLELPIPLPRIALERVVDEAAARVARLEAYVRVTITRRETPDPPRLSVLAGPLEVPDAEAYARGVATSIVRWRRPPPSCFDPSVKTTSYVRECVARREAERAGATEGLQLSVDGALACGAMANLFLVEGDRLLTPDLTSGCRDGVTRRAVLEIAARVGFQVAETRLEPARLSACDEAFLTNTRVACLPIASVDGRPVGAVAAALGYPKTRALRDALATLVRSETEARA